MISSSQVGFRVFGLAVRGVIGDLVIMKTRAHIRAMMAERLVDQAALARHMTAALADVDATPGMGRLAEKRVVAVSYRGAQLNTNVRCLDEQGESMFWAASKEVATELNILGPLMCENELAQKSVVPITAAMDPSLIAAAAAPQSTCNTTLVGKDQGDGPSVKAYLMKQKVSLCATDISFQLEVQFFKEMVGAGGEAAFQARVSALMLTEAAGADVAEVFEGLRALQRTDIFRFTGAGAQGVVESVAGLLDAIMDGVCPVFAGNPTPFLIDIKVRMGNFCRVTPEGENAK